MSSLEESTRQSTLLDAIYGRRSIAVLSEPAPTDVQLDQILHAATSVPDHGCLRPWRFVVIEGDQRERFGVALRDAGRERLDHPTEVTLTKLYNKAFVAPTMIVLVSSPKPGKIERWEQEASAASAGYAMVLAAHVLSLGAMWKSAPVRNGSALRELLGLDEDDVLMGWVNLGTSRGLPLARRNPPVLAELAGRLTPEGVSRWSVPSRS